MMIITRADLFLKHVVNSKHEFVQITSNYDSLMTPYSAELFNHQSKTKARTQLFLQNDLGALPHRNNISAKKVNDLHCQIER